MNCSELITITESSVFIATIEVIMLINFKISFNCYYSSKADVITAIYFMIWEVNVYNFDVEFTELFFNSSFNKTEFKSLFEFTIMVTMTAKPAS